MGGWTDGRMDGWADGWASEPGGPCREQETGVQVPGPAAAEARRLKGGVSGSCPQPGPAPRRRMGPRPCGPGWRSRGPRFRRSKGRSRRAVGVKPVVCEPPLARPSSLFRQTRPWPSRQGRGQAPGRARLLGGSRGKDSRDPGAGRGGGVRRHASGRPGFMTAFRRVAGRRPAEHAPRPRRRLGLLTPGSRRKSGTGAP